MGLVAGIVNGIKGMFVTKDGDPPKASEEEVVRAWHERLYSAQRLAETELPIWLKLENACDGIFPSLITGETGDGGVTYTSMLRSPDQVDVNLIGRALRARVSAAYDRFPALRFSRRPSSDLEVVQAMEKLAEKLMDEGDAVYESKRGMQSAHTRGPTILWPIFRRDTIQETEVVTAKIPPAQFVTNVLAGNDPFIPLGANYEGIAQAAKLALSPATADGKDSPAYFAMTEQQKNDLTLLQGRAERAAKMVREGPQATRLRAIMTSECTPYLSFCLADSSVTDFSKLTWIARKIVFAPEEFRANPSFTDEAKKFAKPYVRPANDGGAPTAVDNLKTFDGKRTADDEGRIVVWEIWDKVNKARYYVILGYPKWVGTTKAQKYPYRDVFGRPLYPDFFPCTWRTPWDRMKESPIRVLGQPGLEPMWQTQVAAIKSMSAFVTGCHSAGDIMLVSKKVSPESLNKVANAQFPSFVQMDDTYNPVADGELSKQFIRLPMPEVPVEFLNSYSLLKRECYESIGLSNAQMTSTPQATTATQESLINQGANAMQGDITRCFEDAFAEHAWKSLLAFLEFANPQEIEAYLGPEALLPRKPNAMPTQGPVDPATGQPTMIPAPPRPSIIEAMQSTDLVGERLVCRFASTTREEDQGRLKNIMDMVMVVSKVRDGANMPYKDLGELLSYATKAADIEVGPYQPTEGEIAIQVAAMTANRGIGGGGGPPDQGGVKEPDGGPPDQSGRKAGNERGQADIPDRHTRGQAPNGASPAVTDRAAAMRTAHTLNP